MTCNNDFVLRIVQDAKQSLASMLATGQCFLGRVHVDERDTPEIQKIRQTNLSSGNRKGVSCLKTR